MFSTYLLRSEQEANTGGNAELKRKQNKAFIITGTQAKAIDKLASRMGTVEERTNVHAKKLKRGKCGGKDND